MRLNWGKTFVLGFGFLAISTVWPLYDSYMPYFLGEFIASSALIGLIMGFDNFLGLTMQPYFGSLSDRTRSRWGRRRPFLLIGMPIAAIAIAMIPISLSLGLVALLITTGVLNLSMSLFRSPAVALMPDLTPSPLRSKANGIINFMGGIGAVIAIVGGAYLYNINPGYPFLPAAVIMLIVFLLFFTVIREPVIPPPDSGVEETPQSLVLALKQVFQNPDRTTLLLFLAICAWFIAYQSINTWFTKYSVEELGVAVNVASARLAIYGGAFVIGAIPAGYIGTWIGRRKTIMIGLVGMALCFVGMNFMTTLDQVTVLLGLAGLAWALININSYPMVVELCHPSQTGTYTGLYYIFAGVAGMGGPFVVGSIFDLMGTKRPLFLFGALFMVIAFVLMYAVNKGEAGVQRAKSA